LNNSNKEEKKPIVSIIVRTKDRPELLKNALRSISSQTHRPLEAVLVNDGGCELPEGELKQILGDVSLKYIRLEKNMGRAHAGNVGIENAKGEYVGFLDDDDIFYKNHIETIIGFLTTSKTHAAYTDAYIVKDRPSKDGYKPFSKETIYAQDFDRDLLLFQNYIPLLCLIVEKELLLKESFDKSFELFEDWDLMIRLSRHAMFHRIPEVTAEYHLRDNNLVVELEPETFPHIEARYKVYRKHKNLLSERSIFIFESLLAEAKNSRQLAEELEKSRIYIKEKEEELGTAKTYIKEKEEELGRAKTYIKEKEEELYKASTYIKEKQEGWKQFPKQDGKITIIIPTLNAEKYLKNLLDSIFTQKIDQEIEVHIIDSSSEDSTCQIAKNYNVNIHMIEKSNFSHPKTRNFGVSLSKGEFIVFLTQDAIPLNDLWLKELISPFAIYPNLAASYSRQIPRSDCNPLEAKDIYIGAPCVDEVRCVDFVSNWSKTDYLNNIHRYIRFSNISSCYRSDLLRNNLFDESLKMVEDQEWCKRMIEKEHPIFYASRSVVIHSHNFGFKQTFNRFFDYGISFKKFLDNHPPKRISSLKATVYDSVNDVLYIINDKRPLLAKLKWICKSPFIRFTANYGLYKGWRYG
jgi:glycosyltransferase involved in cell wall biosynthesis